APSWSPGRFYAKNQINEFTTLTIPLQAHRSQLRLRDVRTRPVHEWVPKHERTLVIGYGQQCLGIPPIELYREALRGLDIDNDQSLHLAPLTIRSTEVLADHLKVNTPRIAATALGIDFSGPSDPNGKLLNLCSLLGATTYLSGPSARRYLDPQLFESRGVRLEFVSYSPYSYRSNRSDFRFSAMDLL